MGDSRPAARVVVMLALCAVIIAGGGTGCRRTKTAAPPAPRPRLAKVEVRDVTAGAPGDRSGNPALETAAIGTLIKRALLQSGLVDDAGVAGADGGTAPRVEVSVRATIGVELAEVEGRGVARTGVRIDIVSRPSDAMGAIKEDLSAGGEQLYEITAETDRPRLAQQLAERTVNDALNGFFARARLATAPPADLHAAIVGDGGIAGVREEAIRTAGARGLRDEIPVLLSLLQHENERIRDAALGALIALKERRAVTELTRNRSLRDRHEMRKILEAVSILGGDEAHDYLSFVAESHEDDEIKKLAADAKGRLERRADR